jgi:acyl-CoA thioesterase-2
LRPGRIDIPIVYQVVRIRDGGSFTTRTVDAIQNGEAIFNMSVSFQKDEGGFEHQFDMPDVPGPEELKSERELRESMMDQIPKEYRDGFLREKAIELRTVEQFNPLNSEKKPPYKHTWMKANGNLPDDILVHQNILAYASDFGLLSTAQLPHGIGWGGMNRKVMAASIDHAMWFHRPFRADEWLLYVTDSPSASNAKGFNRGSVYTQDGLLVASAIQEGLMRKIDSDYSK